LGVPRRRIADSLRFLFQALGFRGKARFVLLLCCACEGSRTDKFIESGRIFFPDISMF
jgi:hypothetical protein